MSEVLTLQSAQKVTRAVADGVAKYRPMNLIRGISETIVKACRGYSSLCADSFTSAYEHIEKHGEEIKSAAKKITKAGAKPVEPQRYFGDTKRFCVTGAGSLLHLGLVIYNGVALMETGRIYYQKWNNKGSFNVPDEDIARLGLTTAASTVVGTLPILSSASKIAHLVADRGSKAIGQNPGIVTKSLGTCSSAFSAVHKGTFGALQYVLPKPLKFLGSYKFATQMLFLAYLLQNEFFVKMPEGKSIFQNLSIGGKYLFRVNEISDPKFNMNLFTLRANQKVMEERARSDEDHNSFSAMIVKTVQDWLTSSDSFRRGVENA